MSACSPVQMGEIPSLKFISPVDLLNKLFSLSSFIFSIPHFQGRCFSRSHMACPCTQPILIGASFADMNVDFFKLFFFSVLVLGWAFFNHSEGQKPKSIVSQLIKLLQEMPEFRLIKILSSPTCTLK